MDTIADAGAAPCVGAMLIHLPLSAVLATDPQVKVPVPPFRICTTWLAGAAPPVLMKKPNWPLILSKNAPLAFTVSVTGMVMDKLRVG